jgi:two-component system, LytTR family, response regulator
MNNILKVLLVDDEQDAIDNLEYLLSNYCDDIQIVGTANHVDQAIKLVEEKKPDVVFLDIEMPEKSGFSLLKELVEINFALIFVTAYDQYAIKAFEVSAIDYLLKPIEIERLQEAVKRAKEDTAKKNINSLNLQSLSKQIQEGKITQISVPFKDVYLILKVKQIVYIKAEHAYTVIYYQSENNLISSYIYSKNLSYFENLFSLNSMFYRSHRSWIINLNYVEAIVKQENLILMKNMQKIPISRRKIKEFKEFIKR